MPKISKEKAIELICEELKQGVTYKATYGVICSKSELAESTFANYWKIANERHTESEQKLNSIAAVHTIGEEVAAKKQAINDKLRRIAILNKKFNELADVLPKIVKVKDSTGKIIEHKITKADYLKTIEVMGKLDERISKAEGTDAPIGINHSGKVDSVAAMITLSDGTQITF
jgi:GTP1/Obg family GTP-binding protein